MMFRNQGQAFSTDEKSIGISTKILDNENMKKCYRYQEMYTILFPFFRSEDPNVLQRLLDECGAFAQKCDEAGDQIWRKQFRGLAMYGNKQKGIIDKYGRFPHNNEALGRKNTPEEDEYMRLRNKK